MQSSIFAPNDARHASLPKHAEVLIERTILSESDPVVAEHRVHGVPILPGVTFLDLIYRALAKNGVALETTQLTNVLFEQPLSLPSGTRDLEVRLSRRGHDAFAIEVVSNEAPFSSRPSFVRHCACDATPATTARRPARDIQALQRGAHETLDLDSIYARAREIGIVHGPFMRGVGRWYVGADYLLAEISLGDEADASRDDFLLHPALLDCSTFCPLYFHPKDAQAAYIPLHVEAFRAFGSLGRRCFALVERPREFKGSVDVLSHDYELLDASGAPLVTFQRISAKRIRHRDSIHSVPKPQVAPVAARVVRGRSVLEEVQSIVAQERGGSLPDNAATLGFYELGLDSAQLLKIVRELEARLGKQLYPTLLFEHPSINELKKFLEQEYGPDCFQGAMDSSPTAPAPTAAAPAPRASEAELLTARPVFLPRRIADDTATASAAPLPPSAVVLIFSERTALWKEALQETDGARVVFVRTSTQFERRSATELACGPNDSAELLASFSAASETVIGVIFDAVGMNSHAVLPAVHELYRATVQSRSGADRHRSQLLVVYSVQAGVAVDAQHAALAAYARCLALEDPRCGVRLVGTEGAAGEAALLRAIDAELMHGSAIHVRYSATERAAETLVEISTGAAVSPPLRRNGVYLITGGAGGIGLILARHLLENWGARVILSGRRSLAEAIATLGANGLTSEPGRLRYLPCDITSAEQTEALVAQVRAEFGQLSGIIHAAGVLHDGLARTKSAADFERALRPKLIGAQNLDRAVGDAELDFFALFSSTSSALGNAGQTDYAFANGCLDVFAAQREQRRAAGHCRGKTVSINWGLWEGGGMSLPAEDQLRLQQQHGVAAISAAAGIQAFETCLGEAAPQVVVIAGDRERLRAGLGLAAVAPRLSAADDDAIAIIGIEGRYPRASSLDEFWQNLATGRDCVQEVPRERWDIARYYAEDPSQPGKTYCRFGGFLDDVEAFDPLFFNISPREATAMDPQERLFLETAWHTLENAGYPPQALRNEVVAVFVGVMWPQRDGLDPSAVGLANFSSIANRVSYFCNFRGPSLAVDTMCSSSLMAVHLACESLRRGESTVALAGGVNLSTLPLKYVHLSRLRMLSASGRCRSFASGGDGYVPGEGVGAVLLKPLARALEDGDQIHAVIRGSFANHGGKSGGYAVPNQRALTELALEALRRAGVPPRSITRVEASGTGTPLGDAIEFRALTRAFRDHTDEVGFCALGSVKSNIGHLESAAGIAALTKVVLELKHRQRVPSLHVDEVNPDLGIESSPFRLQRELGAWRSEDGPLRASVNLFGAGGSNVHVVLEEAAPVASRAASNGALLFPLSARSPDQLGAVVSRFRDYFRNLESASAASVAAVDLRRQVAELLRHPAELLSEDGDLVEYGWQPFHAAALATSWESTHSSPANTDFSSARTLAELSANLPHRGVVTSSPSMPLSDVAYTLQVGRAALDVRLAVIASDLTTLCEALESYLSGKACDALYVRRDRGALRHDASEQVEAALRSCDVKALAELWVLGADVDFDRLYEGTGKRGRRVTLPSYPFARLESPNQATAAAESASGSNESPILGALKQELARVLKLRPEELDPSLPMDRFGLDSIFSLELLGRLQERFGELPQAFLLQHPTLNQQAAALSALGREPREREAPSETASARAPTASLGSSHRLIDVLWRKNTPQETDESLASLVKPERASVPSPEAHAAGMRILLGHTEHAPIVNLLVETATNSRFEVLSAGSGTPVLLLPGLGLSARSWSRQIHDWSPRLRTLVVHPPGVGHSDVPERLDLPSVAAQFVAVLDRLGISEPVHVVGSSFGGMLGQALAHGFPSRVASLTLACSFSEIKPEDGAQFLDKIRADFEQIEAREGRPPGELFHAFLNGRSINAGMQRYFEYILSGKLSTAELLPEIRVRTLVLYGRGDLVHSPEEARELQAQIPNAELAEISEAGHVPNFTHPHEFERLVLPFVLGADSANVS